MLKKKDRLTTEEIESLSQGKSVFGTLLSLRYVRADKMKFAVSVSKKVLKTAVERNRAKRRIYGAIDLKALEKGIGASRPAYVMLMPKKECLDAPTAALSAEISSLLARVL